MLPESPFLYSSLISDFPEGLTDSVIVGGNVHHLANLSTWLKPVAQSESSKWKRCWRASVDGWAASTFHSGCNNKGPTVTIIRVGGKYIFGGYTNLSWGKRSNFNSLNTIQGRPPFSIIPLLRILNWRDCWRGTDPRPAPLRQHSLLTLPIFTKQCLGIRVCMFNNNSVGLLQ